MEIEFDLSDLKEGAVRRMLRQAIMREKNRSLPMHKRKAEDEITAEAEDVDEATEESDEEGEKLSSLHEEKRGKPAAVEMDDEDMSDEAMDSLKPPKKAPPKKKKK